MSQTHLQYTSTKQIVVQDILLFLLDQGVIDSLEAVADDHDALCGALLDVSIACGCPFKLIKTFLSLEFRRPLTSQLPLMEDGNTAAMKLIKQYYIRVGTPFVQELLGGLVIKFASEPDLSLEIDPYYLKPLGLMDLMEKNKETLLEHVRNILAQLCSKKMTDKLPPEVRVVSHFIAELSNAHCPNKKYSLLSTSLMSRFELLLVILTLFRFILRALLKPGDYHLLPEGKVLSPKAKRNLWLVSKLLLNLSYSIEFGEEYLVSFNKFIIANKERIEQFYKDVSFSPPTVNDYTGKYAKAFQYLEQFFQKNAALVLSLVTDEEDVRQATTLITKLQMHKPLEEFQEHRTDYGKQVKLKVVLETENGVYDKEIQGTMGVIEPLVGEILHSLNKIHHKSLLIDTTIFARPLDTVLSRQKHRNPTLKVPEFVDNAIRCLLLKGLKDGTLFSNPGDKEQQDAAMTLRNQINKGEHVDIFKLHPKVVVLTLKQFLKQLPEPLFSRSLISADNAPLDVQIMRLKRMVSLLPSASRHLAQAVFGLLHQFHINSPINHFDVEATSLAMANIFWSVTDDKVVAPLLKLLILNFEFIFSEFIVVEDCKQTLPRFKRRLLTNESVQCIENIDHRLIATSSYNSGIVRLWSAEDYTFMDEYPVGQILSMKALPNGNDIHLWLATDKSIIIWSIAARKALSTIHNFGASTLATNGQLVWANSLKDNSIHVYDVKSLGSTSHALTVPKTINPSVLEIISNYLFVASGNSLAVWNVDTREFVKQLPDGHTKKVKTITKVDDQVWSGAEDSAICIWSYPAFQLVKKIEAHNGKIKSLGFLNNKTYSTSWDCTIRVWNSKTIELEHEIKNHFSDVVSGVAFAWNNRKNCWCAWFCGYDGAIVIFELPDGAAPTAPPSNWAKSLPSARKSVNMGLRTDIKK